MATLCLPMIVALLGGCASRGLAPPAPVPAPAPPAPADPTPTPTESAGIPEIEPAPTDPAILEDLWERATHARTGGRYGEALELLEVVWNADPGYRDVAAVLEEEYRVHGLDAFARGRTDEAVALWRKALRIDPEDRKTLAYLEHAEEQQSRLGEIPGEATPPGP